MTNFAAIPSGGVGVIIGSLIIYFTKSKGRRAALINWVVTLIALPPIFVFFLNCPTVQLVGVTVEYPDGLVLKYRNNTTSSLFYVGPLFHRQVTPMLHVSIPAIAGQLDIHQCVAMMASPTSVLALLAV